LAVELHCYQHKMLRITTTETGGRQTWVLHGQLAGPWAAELRSAWETADARPEQQRVVDLTDVTFVDEAGALVLCAMKNAGVRLIARGVDNKHLIDDLTKNVTPPMRKCLSWLSCSRKDEKETR